MSATEEAAVTLRAAADWLEYLQTDGGCPRCKFSGHWKLCSPPICCECGYHMPAHPDPDALRARATPNAPEG